MWERENVEFFWPALCSRTQRNSYFSAPRKRWWDKYLGFSGIVYKYLIDCGFLGFQLSVFVVFILPKNVLYSRTCKVREEIDWTVNALIFHLNWNFNQKLTFDFIGHFIKSRRVCFWRKIKQCAWSFIRSTTRTCPTLFSVLKVFFFFWNIFKQFSFSCFLFICLYSMLFNMTFLSFFDCGRSKLFLLR